MEQVPPHYGEPVVASSTVSCVLAIDGGDRLAKEWLALSNGYIPAIIKCVAPWQWSAMLCCAMLVADADAAVATAADPSSPGDCARPLAGRWGRCIHRHRCALLFVVAIFLSSSLFL